MNYGKNNRPILVHNSCPEKGTDYPFDPIVHIVPKHHTRTEDGRVLLSPNLMTEEEIDYHIQAYKEDLDHVGRLAKRALRRAIKRNRDR